MTNKEVTRLVVPTKKGAIPPPATVRAKHLRLSVISPPWSRVPVHPSYQECGRGCSANEPYLQEAFGSVLQENTSYVPRPLSSFDLQHHHHQHQAMNYEKQHQRPSREPQPYLEPVSLRASSTAVEQWRKQVLQARMELNNTATGGTPNSTSSSSLQNTNSWRHSQAGAAAGIPIPPPRVLKNQKRNKQKLRRAFSDADGSLSAQHHHQQQKGDLAYMIVDLQNFSTSETGELNNQESSEGPEADMSLNRLKQSKKDKSVKKSLKRRFSFSKSHSLSVEGKHGELASVDSASLSSSSLVGVTEERGLSEESKSTGSLSSNCGLSSPAVEDVFISSSAERQNGSSSSLEAKSDAQTLPANPSSCQSSSPAAASEGGGQSSAVSSPEVTRSSSKDNIFSRSLQFGEGERGGGVFSPPSSTSSSPAGTSTTMVPLRRTSDEVVGASWGKQGRDWLGKFHSKVESGGGSSFNRRSQTMSVIPDTSVRSEDTVEAAKVVALQRAKERRKPPSKPLPYSANRKSSDDSGTIGMDADLSETSPPPVPLKKNLKQASATLPPRTIARSPAKSHSLLSVPSDPPPRFPPTSSPPELEAGHKPRRSTMTNVQRRQLPVRSNPPPPPPTSSPAQQKGPNGSSQFSPTTPTSTTPSHTSPFTTQYSPGATKTLKERIGQKWNGKGEKSHPSKTPTKSSMTTPYPQSHSTPSTLTRNTQEGRVNFSNRGATLPASYEGKKNISGPILQRATISRTFPDSKFSSVLTGEPATPPGKPVNPEYEEINDWVPGGPKGGSYPSQKGSKSKSSGRGGGRGGPPPALEGLVLSDGSENGEGDDYVDMKSFVPPLSQLPNQAFTVTPDKFSDKDDDDAYVDMRPIKPEEREKQEFLYESMNPNVGDHPSPLPETELHPPPSTPAPIYAPVVDIRSPCKHPSVAPPGASQGKGQNWATKPESGEGSDSLYYASRDLLVNLRRNEQGSSHN